jgi:hypothetical protein
MTPVASLLSVDIFAYQQTRLKKGTEEIPAWFELELFSPKLA